MWQSLLDLDRELLLALNGDGGAFWDAFFYFVTARLTWIPLYAVLLYAVWRRFGTRGLLWVVLFLGATVIADDQICNFFKHNGPGLPGRAVRHGFRPCGHQLLDRAVHFRAVPPEVVCHSHFRMGGPAGVQPDLSGRALSDGYSVRSAARPVAGGRLGQALPEADATDGGGFPGII